MGKRGPAPKPTLLKLVSGNPGGRQLNTREPVPPAGEPPLPEWLDPDSAAIWRQLVPKLSAIGLARPIDGYQLGRYCQLLAMWMEDTAFLRKNGPTYPIRAEPDGDGKQGRIIGFRAWPQKTTVLRINRELMAIEREFGMSPSARSRITVGAESNAKGDVSELKRKFLSAPAQNAGA